MHKVLNVLVLAATVTGIALPALASDNVKAKYGPATQYIRVEDKKVETLCDLKRKIAQEWRLEMRRFDLRYNRRLLDDRKTLAELNIYTSDVIEVWDVERSNQCD